MFEFESIVFYFFAFLTLSAALGVILVSNPIYAALFLVLAFVASAGIWLLLYAEFLAMVLVLVYVGAVMVLFLFVLMMLDINIDTLREGFWRYLPFAVIIAVLFAAEIILVLTNPKFTSVVGDASAALTDDNTRALGSVLYTEYLYPFELASVLLLVAIVAAVALTLRRRINTRYINPATQVQTKPTDRVRLVSVTKESPLQFSSPSNDKKGKTSCPD
ncbi:MAG: NADH-quinone oxidoreductase subunit J [Proteobacteria bacterium]|nr:NADH-quinone oxidoreductase subunit J [Pseudomonadota bacterium]